MVKVKFNQDYAVQAVDGEKYTKGQTVDLEEKSANHFVVRGVADYVEAKKVKNAS